jgi:electron transfer flavoprotein alpha subunit
LTRLIASVAQTVGANTVVFSHDLIGKAVAPRLSVRMNAGLVAGAIAVPEADGSVKVNVFSGKAVGFVKVASAKQSVVPVKYDYRIKALRFCSRNPNFIFH